MNWKTILLESPEKKVNGFVVKPRRVIRGVCEIDGALYYLDYILFSGFNWWAAIKTDAINVEDLKTSEIEKYFNSKTKTFVNYENLPDNIKSLC